MPTGTIDSAIFKDIFGTEAMRQVWSDGNRIQKYLDFEAGLARAQARLKIIPQEACDEILKHVTFDQFDIEKLKTETERIGHLSARLTTLGPAATLTRGYAVVQTLDASGSATVLRSVDDAPAGTRLRIRVADGAVTTVSEGSDEAH